MNETKHFVALGLDVTSVDLADAGLPLTQAGAVEYAQGSWQSLFQASTPDNNSTPQHYDN